MNSCNREKKEMGFRSTASLDVPARSNDGISIPAQKKKSLTDRFNSNALKRLGGAQNSIDAVGLGFWRSQTGFAGEKNPQIGQSKFRATPRVTRSVGDA